MYGVAQRVSLFSAYDLPGISFYLISDIDWQHYDCQNQIIIIIIINKSNNNDVIIVVVVISVC